MDYDIPEFTSEPAPGQFPYRLTHEDRFQYRVKVQPVAGQLEFSIRAVDTRLAANAAKRAFEGYPKRIGPAPETDRQDNIRKAIWRAKAKVKLLAMECRVDRLLTFTIRKTGDACMSYGELLKAWDIFRRMAARADKNFHYVAAPEVQKNGQFHIHAGVHGFINVRNYTRMWQIALNRVLGRSQSLYMGEDSPGTCNVTKRLTGSQCGKSKNIAKYIAKYIGKALEAGFGRKSYFHTIGIVVTPAKAQWLEAQSRDDAYLEVVQKYDLLWALMSDSISVWNRDGCSAWFTVPAKMAAPPPF